MFKAQKLYSCGCDDTVRTALLTTAGQVWYRFEAGAHNNEELTYIIERSAKILGIETEHDGAVEIASRSRGTPRIANRLLRRVRDFAEVTGTGVITKEAADYALTSLEIDKDGLDAIDRRLLSGIITNYGGGPVGLDTIADSQSTKNRLPLRTCMNRISCRRDISREHHEAGASHVWPMSTLGLIFPSRITGR